MKSRPASWGGVKEKKRNFSFRDRLCKEFLDFVLCRFVPRGVKYESAEPPTRVFKNHYSCKQFLQFVTETILQRIESGAFRVWGKAGEVASPHLVLPRTIEPQKPRLCIDARFFNVWMVDNSFSLETMVCVPRFVYPNPCMSKIGDKSGYDRICFPLIPGSILLLNGRGGGWSGLRFPSVGRIPRLYTRLLVWVQQFFSGV